MFIVNRLLIDLVISLIFHKYGSTNESNLRTIFFEFHLTQKLIFQLRNLSNLCKLTIHFKQDDFRQIVYFINLMLLL